MKKILVTGANGFLGLRFCQILNERGYSVKALVRRREAAQELKRITEVEVISKVWDKDSLKPALENVDTIIHLAGRAHIINEESKNSYELFRRANVDTTQALLEAASNTGVRKFLFMSSIIAMGLTSKHVLTEEDPCKPVTPYGRSKLEAEEIVKKLAGQSKIQYVILRPPLVYGPGNRANMLRLFRLAAKGLPIPLGALSNRRSFIYIDNAVEAALAALEYPVAEGKTFLVSDGEDVSTPELIRTIAKALGRPCRLISVSPALLRLFGIAGDGMEKLLRCSLSVNTQAMRRLLGSLAVDSSKIKRVTGWMPRYSLTDGLRITAEWYLKTDKAKRC